MFSRGRSSTTRAARPPGDNRRVFRELFAILTTSDIDRALAFYRDLLGFEMTFRFPDSGDPAYVGLQLGASQLGIGAGPATRENAERPFALWVYCDDCDAAVEKLRAHGVPIVEEPQDQPWGERVAEVADPDGNRVFVGS
jgi:lactoylglutathione lyase